MRPPASRRALLSKVEPAKAGGHLYPEAMRAAQESEAASNPICRPACRPFTCRIYDPTSTRL